ncbi:PREDICTED: chitobiosyldiphosphodolichol beta-mannosyltransferase-like [Rhagoletis zephyria]|uniref:chitobiosyldiphosphodolichol beta-mannosyltransferase-like n=1 Tax=Rhagoletis zephyria TaxID=28612 RepID=UPI000811446B|nr:PREDICTED: chitobiosyldiphosphodolichol beta-mannosyltransferase-like [Rhagoletis zephyria]XP_017473384.1 PREDICTED: chitobiosyldiphosphodolichol beta-mannosyltransferase-like [Rhagoletis zephyria]XP_036330597.1 chitobiosyldiphosphodolichol beta-mannosyltransferase-like [Rhagoletis pomonella]
MAEAQIGRRNACIVVLGDIGRSPRMQYHAVSLLEENFNVDIVGYVETKPLDVLVNAPKCKIHELSPVPVTNLTPKLKLVFKTFWQTLSLLIALVSIRRPNCLLVQNPPGVPTLIVCYLYCALTRTKFVIDWHNYTYTILALGNVNGEKSGFCRLAKWIERSFGSKANANFCVTKAMQQDLILNWNIGPAVVLYDRPPTQFHPIELAQKHELFMKLSKVYPQFLPKCYLDLKESGVIETTALTQKLINGNVSHKPQRAAIVVSSTSWTPDEDFSILLKALEDYENTATARPKNFPSLLCIITGKGPQKQEYETQIAKLKWSKVSIITPWLEVEDYPLILAAADLGVCLHWSSSGLDLPMKVVDMFGCGLPVCAYNFKCLGELVTHGQNGFIFENQKELADQLIFWFENFPSNPRLLETKERFRKNLHEFQSLRWHGNWKNNALPVFNSFT